MKNNKLELALSQFSAAVRKYILLEYRSAYQQIYSSIKITRDVRKLSTDYYFGGNTVQFTAGQIVDYVRSKYKQD
jgi:hypothetical protein